MKIPRLNKVEKTIIVSCIIILFLPILFTQFSVISLTKSGQYDEIGDAIGGITAPFIGILTTYLLYLTLKQQNESNNFMIHEANFRIIYNEILEFKKQVNDFKLLDTKGTTAIKNFHAVLFTQSVVQVDANNKKAFVEYYEILLNDFIRIFSLFETLQTGKNYKLILLQELTSIHKASIEKTHQLILNEKDTFMHDTDKELQEKIMDLFKKIELIESKIHTN